MRIISGNLKGKKINPPKDKLTRPLKDMVKESIFNILEHSNEINHKIENSIVLDLFSGSGSFGLECISRGAKYVFFNENYNEAIRVLEKNIHNLKCENKCKVIKISCFDLIQSFEESVDLVFLDPPFKEEKINQLIELVLQMKILKKDGLMIIHRNKQIKEDLSPKLKIIDIRHYGLSKIIFGN
tara:strand:+ start:255 stop:806 length:552 start_codon:yes stop_codon:yes gene_type:complete